MKKLALLVTAVLLLFLASGCQEAAPKRVEQTAEGMILVNGPVEGEPDDKIYGEPDPETMVSFPLDAAMVYYGSDPNGFGGAGQQNLTDFQFSVYIKNEDPAEAWQVAGSAYRCVEGAENKVYLYDLHSDEKGVWFRPSDLIQVIQLQDYTAFTIKREESMVEMKVSAAVPAVSLTISCRKEEQELAAETLRVEEMQRYTEYPLPEGTDRVEIVTWDAEGKEIERKALDSTDDKFPVPYDIGGQFLGVKKLELKWK